jgi:hypothetical protein
MEGKIGGRDDRTMNGSAGNGGGDGSSPLSRAKSLIFVKVPGRREEGGATVCLCVGIGTVRKIWYYSVRTIT